jgi:hypothetical protein
MPKLNVNTRKLSIISLQAQAVLDSLDTFGDQICISAQEVVSKHNFWTARVELIKNYIFGILSSRAVD